MHWRWRAAALRSLGRAPGGRWLYQRLQQLAGQHRRPEFVRRQLEWQARLARGLAERGAELEGARVAEVGTGWVPLAAVGFWLCGAARVDTYDIDRWLLPETFAKALGWIATNRGELRELWRPFTAPAALDERLDRLAELAGDPERLLAAAGIRYHAPADARATGLADGSVDLHVSMQVLEHVAAEHLPEIHREAARVLEPGGWSAHQIDPTDHFSHFDPSITAIHFLRFDEAEWRQIVDRSLASHNRLRCHQHEEALAAGGLEVMAVDSEVDERALAALESGFRLAEPFRGMAPEDVCRRSVFTYARRL